MKRCPSCNAANKGRITCGFCECPLPLSASEQEEELRQRLLRVVARYRDGGEVVDEAAARHLALAVEPLPDACVVGVTVRDGRVESFSVHHLGFVVRADVPLEAGDIGHAG